MTKRWFKWERESGVLTISLCCEGGYSSFKERFGISYPTTYLIFEDEMVSWMNDFDELYKRGAVIVKKLLDDDFNREAMKDWENACEDLRKICKELNNTDLSSFDKQELLKKYQEFYKIHFHWWTIGMLAEMVSYGGEYLLREILSKKFKTNKFNKKQNEQFNLLTSPTKKSFFNGEEESLMNVLKNMNDGSEELIREHVKKYYWLQNNYLDTKYLDKDYFVKIINELIDKKVDPDEAITAAAKRLEETKIKKEELIDELDFNEEEKKIVWIIDDFILFQDTRKMHNLRGLHALDLFLKEISNDISMKELKYLVPQEVEDAILGKIDKEAIKERIKFCIVEYSIDGCNVLVENKAKELIENVFGVDKDLEEVREITGMNASSGTVVGKVRIIKSPKNIDKMQEGEVLVTTMTSPDFVLAMKKAAAIITDEGGITCHAAIVARELGIPCIIGTKIATKVLKDGDEVEVKANHGVVKII